MGHLASLSAAPSRLLLVVLSLLTQNDAFDQACPCVDISSALGQADANGCLPYVAAMGVNPTVYCYPPGYGSSGCSAWDSTLPPNCTDVYGTPLAQREQYCALSWCYGVRIPKGAAPFRRFQTQK